MKQPRVGLLSIGEEEHKGNELTRTATPLLKSLAIHFIGNVEGRDLYSGKVESSSATAFIGNVALKVSEGLVEVVKQMLQESLQATITRKIGYVLSRAAFQDFQEARGLLGIRRALLLGVRGVCSSATAARTPTRSRTRSGWRPSSPTTGLTSASKPSCAVGRRHFERPSKQPADVNRRASILGLAILAAGALGVPAAARSSIPSSGA